MTRGITHAQSTRSTPSRDVRRALTWALVGGVFGIAVLVGGGCNPRRPDVDTDTPEEAAESVGRVICAEHTLRVNAILDAFDDAIAVQDAKGELLADTTPIRDAQQRLVALAKLFEEQEDALRSCVVALTDIDVVAKDVKVYVALEMRVGDWQVDDAGGVEIASRNYPVLLTLTRIHEAWRVTESNIDLALPGGALDSLLD